MPLIGVGISIKLLLKTIAAIDPGLAAGSDADPERQIPWEPFSSSLSLLWNGEGRRGRCPSL